MGKKKIDINKFKINGFLFTVATGEYDSYEETTYLFSELPDLEQMRKEVDEAWNKESGNFDGRMKEKVFEIVEKHGGIKAPSIGEVWTDDYGTAETDFRNHITGIDSNWERKI